MARARSGEAKKSGKRRRWKLVRHDRPPELILPPPLRAALGLRQKLDPCWFEAADRALAQCHARYDGGDKSALLDAVDVLAVYFPSWAQEAFAKAWSDYRQHAAATLDEAFGIERPKGQHQKEARAREVLRGSILFRVYYLHYRERKPLDAETFAQVASELGISPGQVVRIFRERASDGLRELLRNLQISDMSEIG